MIRQLLRTLVVALSLTAGLAVAPTPATAAETGAARLSKTLDLSSYPPDGSETTWSRNIDLARGHDKWYGGVTDTASGNRRRVRTTCPREAPATDPLTPGRLADAQH